MESMQSRVPNQEPNDLDASQLSNTSSTDSPTDNDSYFSEQSSQQSENACENDYEDSSRAQSVTSDASIYSDNLSSIDDDSDDGEHNYTGAGARVDGVAPDLIQLLMALATVLSVPLSRAQELMSLIYSALPIVDPVVVPVTSLRTSRSRLLDAEKAVEKFAEEKKGLQEEIASLTEMNNRLEAKIRDGDSSTAEELEYLRQRIKDFEEREQVSNAAKLEMEEELIIMSEEVGRLQEELNNMSHVVQGRDQKIFGLEKEIASLKASLAANPPPITSPAELDNSGSFIPPLHVTAAPHPIRSKSSETFAEPAPTVSSPRKYPMDQDSQTVGDLVSEQSKKHRSEFVSQFSLANIVPEDTSPNVERPKTAFERKLAARVKIEEGQAGQSKSVDNGIFAPHESSNREIAAQALRKALNPPNPLVWTTSPKAEQPPKPPQDSRIGPAVYTSTAKDALTTERIAPVAEKASETTHQNIVMQDNVAVSAPPIVSPIVTEVPPPISVEAVSKLSSFIASNIHDIQDENRALRDMIHRIKEEGEMLKEELKRERMDRETWTRTVASEREREKERLERQRELEKQEIMNVLALGEKWKTSPSAMETVPNMTIRSKDMSVERRPDENIPEAIKPGKVIDAQVRPSATEVIEPPKLPTAINTNSQMSAGVHKVAKSMVDSVKDITVTAKNDNIQQINYPKNMHAAMSSTVFKHMLNQASPPSKNVASSPPTNMQSTEETLPFYSSNLPVKTLAASTLTRGPSNILLGQSEENVNVPATGAIPRSYHNSSSISFAFGAAEPDDRPAHTSRFGQRNVPVETAIEQREIVHASAPSSHVAPPSPTAVASEFSRRNMRSSLQFGGGAWGEDSETPSSRPVRSKQRIQEVESNHAPSFLRQEEEFTAVASHPNVPSKHPLYASQISFSDASDMQPYRRVVRGAPPKPDTLGLVREQEMKVDKQPIVSVDASLTQSSTHTSEAHSPNLSNSLTSNAGEARNENFPPFATMKKDAREIKIEEMENSLLQVNVKLSEVQADLSKFGHDIRSVKDRRRKIELEHELDELEKKRAEYRRWLKVNVQ